MNEEGKNEKKYGRTSCKSEGYNLGIYRPEV